MLMSKRSTGIGTAYPKLPGVAHYVPRLKRVLVKVSIRKT